MKETIKLGVVLFLVTSLAGGILAGVNGATAPVIAEMERQESFSALLEIFPDANDFIAAEDSLLEEIKETNGSVFEVYKAVKDGEELGYALKTLSAGYGGDITTLIGINNEGTISGLRVLVMSETKGLGSRIVDDLEFRESFLDKNALGSLTPVEEPSADNEVMLLSGATTSTKAVLKGVNDALDAYAKYLSN
ncbi:MAG: RnfABCDGE type electron transport complex subunit G [Tissierellia bacterium]|nr:RnfABCDGE type electron transport complex subunit G [Tissierellia bacterium]